MKVIQTKYLCPTNYREGRIKASDEDGNAITIEYPHEAGMGEPAHRVAAEALQRKMGWDGELIGGSLKDSYVFVVLPRRSNHDPQE